MAPSPADTWPGHRSLAMLCLSIPQKISVQACVIPRSVPIHYVSSETRGEVLNDVDWLLENVVRMFLKEKICHEFPLTERAV